MIDVEKIRSDFTLFDQEKSSVPVYFDNACMSLRPKSVVSAIPNYYNEYPACAGRSSHKMASKVTNLVDETRRKVAKFINARNEKEIIFTRNTTEGINLLANSLDLKIGDTVLITDKEHNSNMVPWLLLRDKVGIKIEVIPSNEDNSFNLEKYSELVQKAKLVSIVHTSNLDGTTNPAKEIIKIAHQSEALVFLDCAQSMIHQKIDVENLDVDFLAFSGHKMLGPTGTGVFYGKEDLLRKLKPFLVGGDTVSDVNYDGYSLLGAPEKFEAGLQDYSGILGLGQAVLYLENIDYTEIQNHERKINKKLTEGLMGISDKIKIIGPQDPNLRSGIVNFYIEDKSMHQIAVMLDEMANIAVRSGRHCVHSWFNQKKITNSLRVSFAFYNNEEEIQIFINNFKNILEII
jgi:cysteine desulfurase / selenocysteine lyase